MVKKLKIELKPVSQTGIYFGCSIDQPPHPATDEQRCEINNNQTNLQTNFLAIWKKHGVQCPLAVCKTTSSEPEPERSQPILHNRAALLSQCCRAGLGAAAASSAALAFPQ